MAKHVIRSHRNPPPRGGEYNHEPSSVETAGYIPPKQQMEALMRSGLRLMADRRVKYDFASDEPIPDDFIDITRDRDFDVFTAMNVLKDIREKRKMAPTGKEPNPETRPPGPDPEAPVEEPPVETPPTV